MAEKRIITGFKKKKTRVKSKKKVAPLSKQTVFHIGKSFMKYTRAFEQVAYPVKMSNTDINKMKEFGLNPDSFEKEKGDRKSCYEVLSDILNQQELEDFEL